MPLKYKAQVFSGGFTSPCLERIRNNATVGQLKIQVKTV
jgi:hypothetical protein